MSVKRKRGRLTERLQLEDEVVMCRVFSSEDGQRWIAVTGLTNPNDDKEGPPSPVASLAYGSLGTVLMTGSAWKYDPLELRFLMTFDDLSAPFAITRTVDADDPRADALIAQISRFLLPDISAIVAALVRYNLEETLTLSFPYGRPIQFLNDPAPYLVYSSKLN